MGDNGSLPTVDIDLKKVSCLHVYSVCVQACMCVIVVI